MRMHKYCLVIITVLISITNTTFSTADPGLQPAVAAGSTIDAATAANAIGSTLTAEAQTNTIAAKRQEFKDTITKNEDTEPTKAIVAAQELIKFENKEDIVWLIQHMAGKPKSNLNVKIKQEILAYPNQSFITTALIKAGQALSPDINLLAADMLLDKKEEAKAGIIMVALIKKGVMTRQVVDIRDRIVKQGKIEVMRMTNDIYGALCDLVNNDAVPEDVQAFALLMQASFISASFDSGRAEWIEEIIDEAKHEYLICAVDLLGKANEFNLESPDVPKILLRKLMTSKDVEVAEKATRIVRKYRSEEKERLWSILNGKDPVYGKDERRTDYYLREYLALVEDTPEQIKLYLGLLEKDRSPYVRGDFAIVIMNSKYCDLGMKLIKKLAVSDPSAKVREDIIRSFIALSKEEEAYNYYEEYFDFIIKTNFVPHFNLAIGPGGFRNEKIIKKVNRLQIKTFKKLQGKEYLQKAFLLLCIAPNYVVDDKEISAVLTKAFGNIETENAKNLTLMLSDADSINKEFQIGLFKKISKSKNKEIAQLANNALGRMNIK